MKIKLTFVRTHKGYHQFSGLKQLTYLAESGFADGSKVTVTVEGDALNLAPVAAPLTEAEKAAEVARLQKQAVAVAEKLAALGTAVPAKKARLVKKPVAAVAPVADGAAAQ